MIHKIIGLVIFTVIVVFGLSVYLSPNDLEKCDTPGDGDCRVADAIIVVSGGDTNARTDEAIKLYKSGWAPLIIVSGAAADKSGPSNAKAMYQRAVNSGVPKSAIVMEESSETTKQNATEVKKIIDSKKIKDVILVTSGYHMRRAQLEFSSQFQDVKIRSHPVVYDKSWSPWWWITPWGWWLALGELMRIGLFALGLSR